MPYRAWNKASAETKRRFFELIRQGWSGQAASLAVGVSPSCGSLWFIDAGRVQFVDTPICSRYLSQHDRIEIADGLAAVSRSKRSRRGSGRAIRRSTGRSRVTGNRMVAISRGSRTTGPTSVADDRGRGGWRSMRTCAPLLPAGWPSTGPRGRSVAGCVAAGQVGGRGI